MSFKMGDRIKIINSNYKPLVGKMGFIYYYEYVTQRQTATPLFCCYVILEFTKKSYNFYTLGCDGKGKDLSRDLLKPYNFPSAEYAL